MSMAAVIRELVAAGLTGDALVAAVERIEAAQAPAKSKHAEAQRRYMAKKMITNDHCDYADHNDHTEANGDHLPSQMITNDHAAQNAPSFFPSLKKEKKDGADAPPIDPDADLFRRGKEVLGKEAGSLIARLKRAKKGSIPQTRAALEQASTKENPREYIGAVLKGAAEKQDDFNSPLAGII